MLVREERGGRQPCSSSLHTYQHQGVRRRQLRSGTHAVVRNERWVREQVWRVEEEEGVCVPYRLDPPPIEKEEREQGSERGILVIGIGWTHMSECLNGKNVTEEGRSGIEGKTKFNLGIQIGLNFPTAWRSGATFMMAYR